MNLMIAIVGAVFAIFSIILLHELGHFFAARLCGIKVLRFSVGFGAPLFKYVGRSGTEYVLAVFPLGGYVRMLGENEQQAADSDESHLSFSRQPLWKRASVVLAGPAINFLLAIVAFWAVFLIGVTHVKPIIGSLAPNSVAAKSGLQAGDQLIKIGGVKTPNWQHVMMALIMHLGDQGQMTVLAQPRRSSKVKTYQLNLDNWSVDRRNPQVLKSLGIMPYEPKVPAVLAQSLPGSPAEKAGFKPGDRVVSINSQKVTDWKSVVSYVQAHPDQRLAFHVKRNGQFKRLSVEVKSKSVDGQKVGYIGAEVQAPEWPASLLQEYQHTFLGAGLSALDQTRMLTVFNFVVMVKMVTGKISLHTLGGPITIFRAAGQASQAGLQIYLGFIAFISLTVGFLNLLPIPGLDGGHLFFQAIEAVFRRPVPERYQMVGLTVGIIFLLFLMVQATVNDVLRLF